MKAANRTLKMLKDHPIMTAEGWKRAKNLKTTDKIMDASEAFVKMDSIESDQVEYTEEEWHCATLTQDYAIRRFDDEENLIPEEL